MEAGSCSPTAVVHVMPLPSVWAAYCMVAAVVGALGLRVLVSVGMAVQVVLAVLWCW